MRRNPIRFEYARLGVGMTIGCNGTGYGTTFDELRRGCNNCPIRFRCLTSNGTINLETEEEYNKIVNWIQGR